MNRNRFRQFARYITRTLKIHRIATSVSDGRAWSFIPTSTMFWAVFCLYAFRLKSILNLERKLGTRRFQRIIRTTGNRTQPAKKDSIRHTLDQFCTDDLRNGLVKTVKRMKRMKVWDDARWGRHIVIAIDGVELFSSEKRSCSACCKRQVERKTSDGSTETVVQYYHKVVLAQVIGADVRALLDVEPIQPGQEEPTATYRLLDRLLELYGSQFFGIIVVDGLYLTAPFVNRAREAGWHVIVRIKKDSSLLKRDAEGLFNFPARKDRPHYVGEGEERRQIVKWKIWEASNLSTMTGVDHPMRVLKVQEWSRPKRRKQFHRDPDIWIATTMTPSELSANRVRQLMHHRWEVENSGNRELKSGWNLSHCLVHKPSAILNALLIAFIAFNAFTCFAHRRLRNYMQRYDAAYSDLVEEIRVSLAQLRYNKYRLLYWDPG